ncbi:hypothetical protein AAZV13_12G071300 [Glycine max]
MKFGTTLGRMSWKRCCWKTISCWLRWYETRCPLTKIQPRRGKSWCPWMISRDSNRQRCNCTWGLHLRKLSLSKSDITSTLYLGKVIYREGAKTNVRSCLVR